MEKSHIGRIMLWESLLTSAFSLILGLGVGILFNKLVTLILYKMLRFNPNYTFSVSPVAVLITLALFCFIFFATLLSSLWQVCRATPIELLSGGSVGEREPKSNFLLALIGLLTLGGGYYIALALNDPFAVFYLFFIAALLVIIGTYCLFTAGSIVLLKFLKKNNDYYYQTKHFVSLSSMVYRMNKNAVGLANICILSTAVLVTVSTTISLYVGIDDVVSYKYPYDVYLELKYSPHTRPDIKSVEQSVKNIVDSDNIKHDTYKSFEYLTFSSVRENDSYSSYVTGADNSAASTSILILTDAESYGKLTGNIVSLNKGEAIVYSSRDSGEITIFDKPFKVIKNFTGEPAPISNYRGWLVDIVYVIVDSSNTLDEFYQIQSEKYGENKSNIAYGLGFDLKMSNSEILDYTTNKFVPAVNALSDKGYSFICDVKQVELSDFYELYGGLFFLGTFLGFLFLLATVLIIYYKQVVEGNDDKERFRIMQNVGMSRAEVRQAIGSQVLTVFALPLIAAVVHIAVAFPMLKNLLILLNLTNVDLFIICTICTIFVFAMIYGIVYMLTSKIYYKIVDGK